MSLGRSTRVIGATTALPCSSYLQRLDLSSIPTSDKLSHDISNPGEVLIEPRPASLWGVVPVGRYRDGGCGWGLLPEDAGELTACDKLLLA